LDEHHPKIGVIYLFASIIGNVIEAVAAANVQNNLQPSLEFWRDHFVEYGSVMHLENAGFPIHKVSMVLRFAGARVCP
jgi:hypothetical protein